MSTSRNKSSNKSSGSYLHIPPKPNVRIVAWFGLFVLVFFVGGFLFWAATYPLESAAVAPGKVVIESNRKVIQHLEGGIVTKILVHEGQTVKAGDNLIILDQTDAIANLAIYRGQTNLLLAKQAWLIAARDKATEVQFPKRLLDLENEPGIQQLMKDAVEHFKADKNKLEDGIQDLKNQIEQSKSDIATLNARIKSSTDQLKLINDELGSWTSLAQQNYVDKPRVLALKREQANLQGDLDGQKAQIEKDTQKISEAEIQMVNLIDSHNNDIYRELEETQYNLISSIQKEKETEDILKRSVIIAPIEGIVQNLKVHTVGGVIAPREPILEIIPQNEILIIEARVSPQDINVVRPGLVAKIRLTTYKQRHTPTIDGTVETVSADSLYDEQTHESYYLARIKIEKEQLEQLKEVKLYPGMPAQVLIIVSNRTALQYFMQPIYDSFASAFREQ